MPTDDRDDRSRVVGGQHGGDDPTATAPRFASDHRVRFTLGHSALSRRSTMVNGHLGAEGPR